MTDMAPAEARIFKTVCSDKRCQAVLYIGSSDKIVECFQCGQKHNKNSLEDLREVPSGDNEAIKKYVYRMLIYKNLPKRGPEMVKVLGLSNYYCKILSPLLTRYGMDKNTGRAKLLTEMNQGEIFDCSVFGDRTFLIEPEHISIPGYGRDVTGSLHYLSETLKLIVAANGCEERLIPIHADGDGHCLVHAVSRALVGRELFWHPLRCCLKKHFEMNIEKYKELFKDFIDTDEWASIIEECDPNFQPPEGELHGLRNIHIFGLANVLKRPIILLDSLECMQKCGDYSALFVPGFVEPDDCKGKDNVLNRPICIAWSSYSHNHYIPLVGVQKMPLPILPSVLIPKVWGMPQNVVDSYIEFDSNKNCVIGGNRSLSNGYVQRLVHAMEVLYYETYGIHPSLVADAKLYLFADNILFSAKPAAVLDRARTAVQEGRLYRCLMCRALCHLQSEEKWPPNNSPVCNQFLQNSKRIAQDSSLGGLVLKYDSLHDSYVIDFNSSEPQACHFCKSTSSLRKVTNDGTVIYKAEDKDNLDRNIWSYDQAKKYDNEESNSQKFTKDAKSTKMLLKLQWKGKEIEDEISCFDYRHSSKESLNEFVKELTKKLIEKHFTDMCSDVELQVYISEELWKIFRKWDHRVTSNSSSKSEFTRQDSAISMKLENTSASGVQSKSSYPQIQYIKVVTSSNQQANLALNGEGISYGQLQEWIRKEFNIPVKSQVIKRGFPPRPIKPSGDTNKQMLTDLKHGDRLIVEVQRKEENYAASLFNFVPPRAPLKEPNTPKPPIKYPSDTSWEAIIANPNNFRPVGFLYQKIAENHELNSSLHITLPEYPDKVFCYNEQTYSIELCIKPFGHFMIAKDIPEKIEEVRQGLHTVGFSPCPLFSESDSVEGAVSFSKVDDTQSLKALQTAPWCTFVKKSDDMDIS